MGTGKKLIYYDVELGVFSKISIIKEKVLNGGKSKAPKEHLRIFIKSLKDSVKIERK